MPAAHDTSADDRRDGPVLYERRGPVAYVTMNRPRYRNAQNSAMTYALDAAFYRAVPAVVGGCVVGSGHRLILP